MNSIDSPPDKLLNSNAEAKIQGIVFRDVYSGTVKSKDSIVGLSVSALFVFTLLLFPHIAAVRFLLSIPFLLFFPGYFLILYLWPERHMSFGNRTTGINLYERFSLSVVTSIGLITTVGLFFYFLGLDFAGVGFSIAIFLLTLSLVLISNYKRIQQDVSKRFLPMTRLPRWFDSKTPADRALRVTTVLLIVAGLVSIGYSHYVLEQQESFSVLYITGADGKISSLPNNMTVGNSSRIVIGIENHEHRAMNYVLSIGVDGCVDYRKSENWSSVYPLGEGFGYLWELNLSQDEKISLDFDFTFMEPSSNMIRIRLREKGERCFNENYLFVEVVE